MISFVRHGETAHNRDGRLQGRVDLELSERGLEQAALLANRFDGKTVTKLLTSPLRRARQTAAAIAAVCGAEVEVDDRLIELDYGDWDGRPLAELTSSGSSGLRDPNFAPPGGESLVAVSERVEAFCREHLATDGAPVVAVSHVSPIKAAVAWALGVDARTTLRMQLGLASISKIGARPDGNGYLLSFNDSAHLEAR